jgi:hypothetical protein
MSPTNSISSAAEKILNDVDEFEKRSKAIDWNAQNKTSVRFINLNNLNN